MSFKFSWIIPCNVISIIGNLWKWCFFVLYLLQQDSTLDAAEVILKNWNKAWPWCYSTTALAFIPQCCRGEPHSLWLTCTVCNSNLLALCNDRGNTTEQHAEDDYWQLQLTVCYGYSIRCSWVEDMLLLQQCQSVYLTWGYSVASTLKECIFWVHCDRQWLFSPCFKIVAFHTTENVLYFQVSDGIIHQYLFNVCTFS